MRSLLCISLLILLSCNNEKGFDPLSEPPYKGLTDSISKEPTNADLYYRRGQLLYSNDQPVVAERDIRKAWNLKPNERYALSLATLLKEKGTDSAIIFLRDAETKLPSSLPVQLELANLYGEKGEGDSALKLSSAILQNFPNSLDALMIQAQVLKDKNRAAESQKILERANALAPSDVEVIHSLAFSYAEGGNPKALKIADSLIAIDLEKVHAEPYYFKGVYYSNTGKPSEALRQYDLAIQRNYNFIEAYINKGIVYYDQKNWKEAAKVFSLATTVSPTEPGPYYWLGKTEEAMGEKAEAKLDYQRAYGLDKTFIEAKQAADRL